MADFNVQFNELPGFQVQLGFGGTGGAGDPVIIKDQENNIIDVIASGGTYNVLVFDTIQNTIPNIIPVNVITANPF